MIVWLLKVKRSLPSLKSEDRLLQLLTECFSYQDTGFRCYGERGIHYENIPLSSLSEM
jgi:hypothetical protein